MLNEAAKFLAERCTFLSLVGGAVKQQKVSVADVVKIIPACASLDSDGAYNSMVPDACQSGIAYFDTIQNKALQELSGTGGYSYAANVRLVVWINTERLAGYTPGAAMASCVSALTGFSGSFGLIKNVKVEPVAEALKSPSIFMKYTYDEAQLQYLMPPYDYFAFDFNFKYILSNSCAPTVSAVSPPAC